MPRNRAFVIGHPIGHSRSPMLHGHWLAKLGIDASYERIDVPPSEVAGFFAAYREAGWIGGNVTVPNKTAVIPFLDRIDDEARAIGAVNTIFWDGDALVGGNTDAYGFIANIDELVPGWDDGASKAVVLGAGGATRAIVHGLLGRGFDVVLANRSPDKARALADAFGHGRVSTRDLADRAALLADCDLLVNATSLGMAGQPPLDIDLAPLKRRAVVYDIVYVPLETPLLAEAAARGHRTVDGLGMLLHQGAASFARWFGRKPDVTRDLREMLIADIRAKTAGAYN